jgi:hypothetical protein
MRILFLAAAATVALASATAMAQNASDTDTKMNPAMNPPAANTTADAPKTTAADVPAKGPDFINLQNSDMLSSNVVGLDIYNQQNDDIGKI